MREELIAPCGMNCSLCIGYQREKNRCCGCRLPSAGLPEYCRSCIIRSCEVIKNSASKFCYECDKFPCPRLKRLDKRYRLRYRMSMLENLEMIKAEGLKAFLQSEEKRWACPRCGGTVSVHRTFCPHCKAALI